MNAPELRFKEFKDSWLSYTLEEVCTFSKGRELSKADLSKNGEPCILYGELYTRYGTIINSITSKTNSKSSSLVRANKNTVLIPSSGETAWDIACASALNVDNVIIGGDLNILIPDSHISGHFLSLQINGKQKVKLSTLAQGATVVHLYADSIKKLECALPSLEEQNKISRLFEILDQKIQLQNEKIDLLKEQKKGYMQKIFKQELRFKEFSGKWEKRKLGELAEVRTGKAFSSADFKADGEYLVVTNKNIQDEANGIPSVGDRINIDDVVVLNNYLLSGDNILVTMDGVNIGKVGKYSNEKAVLAQRVGRLNSDQLEFVYQIVSSNNFTSEMNKLSVGNAIKHISLKQISDYSFLAPASKKEQEKIGYFFESIDRKINLLQEKINLLKQQKQAFMQQMFI